MSTAPISLSLDVNLVAALRAQAKQAGMSLSAYVNRELARRDASRRATSYFRVSERVAAREGIDVDALADELDGDRA